MKSEFNFFYNALSGEEKARFLGAIPLILARIAEADGDISFNEKISVINTLFKAWINFGSEHFSFVFDDELIAMHYSKIETAIEKRKQEIYDEELERIKILLDKMPEDLQVQYKKFIMDASINLAEASSESLWSNVKISEAEQAVIDKIRQLLSN